MTDQTSEQAEDQTEDRSAESADGAVTTQSRQDLGVSDPDREALNATDAAVDDRHTLGVADVAGELLDDWRWLLGGLHARFRTGDFATGLRLVAAIGEAAEAADHHPDVDLRYPFVQVKLASHDVGGVTVRDVRLAREISEAAGRLEAKADVDSLRLLELALDTTALAQAQPFWAAVLGGEAGNDDVVDPDGLLPALWFQDADRPAGEVGEAQPTSGPQAPEQRFHLDVTVAPEVAERRVQEAIEAGGTLVSDGRAPAFWVLADPQGNKVCICTPLGRTESVPVEAPDADGDQDQDADQDTDQDSDDGPENEAAAED